MEREIYIHTVVYIVKERKKYYLRIGISFTVTTTFNHSQHIFNIYILYIHSCVLIF